MPATGMLGTTESVAASVTKPEPVTPAAPLEEMIATAIKASWSAKESGMLQAWAMNKAASDM